MNMTLCSRWQFVEFKEIIEHSAFGPRFGGELYSDNGNVATLRTTDLSPHGEISYGSMPLARIDENKFANHFLRPGDLVISRSGRIGTTAIFDGFDLPVLPGAFLIRFRLNSEANPHFYRYYFNSPMGRSLILSVARGAAQQNINISNVQLLKVPFPPKREQEGILEILSAYDDLIENNRRRIALLEEAARLLYREWFVHLRFPGHEHATINDSLPQGWEPLTLGALVDVVKDTVKPGDFAEDEVHIGLEHIPRRSFTLADWEPAEALASGKNRFAKGDIIFCKIRPYFHKVGFTIRSGLASSDAIVWRVKEQRDWPLVVCATSSDHFVAVASKTVREGSKMPRADEKVLLKYVIPRPPAGLLSIFNENILPITEQCKCLALQNRALAQARDLLLPRLMNGEIAV